MIDPSASANVGIVDVSTFMRPDDQLAGALAATQEPAEPHGRFDQISDIQLRKVPFETMFEHCSSPPKRHRSCFGGNEIADAVAASIAAAVVSMGEVQFTDLPNEANSDFIGAAFSIC